MTSTAVACAKDTAHRPGLHRELAAGIEVVPGTAGDHPAVQLFLSTVFPASSGAEFQSQLDEPHYEPRDRLLIKHCQNVAAHVRLVHRELRFGASVLPVSCLADNATLPEFRGRGYASALLSAAEQQMEQDGAVLGLLRTSELDFYRRRGWIVCGRHSYSTIGCHPLLADLPRQEACPGVRLGDAQPPALHIRYLRRVELAAVIRLHQAQVRQAYGAFPRSEATWRWLLNRRGFDRIYVAIEGAPEIELDGTFSAIVGYAAARDGRLVELVSAPRRPDTAQWLLRRFCSDAIEQDCREIRVDLPPQHPIHAALLASGGAYCRQPLDRGQAFMVKVLDPARLIQGLHAELRTRLGTDKPSVRRELGFVVGDRQWVLELTPHHSSLEPGRVGRSFVRCSRAQFWQLLLGHLDVRQAAQAGRISVSNRLALESACALLPPLPLWFPPLDDLPAK